MTIREQLRDMAQSSGHPKAWNTAVVAGLIIAAALTIYYILK